MTINGNNSLPTFENLVEVMQTVQKQKATITSDNTSKEKIYDDKDKVYVSWKGDGTRTLIIKVGIEGKKAKGISAEELLNTVEKVMDVALQTPAFDPGKNETRLGMIKEGLETLKGRLKAAERSMSTGETVLRNILNVFGYQDKYQAALEKIDRVKTKMDCSIEIKKLEKRNKDLIELLSPHSTDASKKTKETTEELESKIATVKKKFSDLQSKVDSLRADKNKLNINKEKLDELEVSKSNLIVKEKKEDISVQSLKAQLNQTVASSFLSAVKVKKALTPEEKCDLQAALNAAEKTRNETREELKNVTEMLAEKGKKEIEKNLKKTIIFLNTAENELKEKEPRILELNSNETSIKAYKEELQKLGQTLSSLKTSSGQKLQLKEKPQFVSLNLIQNIQQKGQISSKLRPVGDAKKYVEYQHTVIFSSVGRTTTIEELAKEIGVKPKEIKVYQSKFQELLEGGNSADNMCYVSHYLETLIPQVKKGDPINADYIEGLEKLQADLQRSLYFAVSASTNMKTTTAKSLSTEIREALEGMKNGERLLIPTGAGGHQTLLVFKKTENNEIQTTFYNTGEGVERYFDTKFSLKNFGKSFEGTPLSVTYSNIDINSKNDQTRFESMMTNILQFPNQKEHTTKDLYTSLEENLQKEGEKLTLGPEKKAQINGICSFQCLDEAYEDILGPNYNHFKLDSLTRKQSDFQEITDALQPVDDQNDPIHQLRLLMLKKNQAEINATSKTISSKR